MQRNEPGTPPPAIDDRAACDAPPPKEDVLLNPRRSPRLRLCCPTRLASGGRTWNAHTEDVGPRGCQVVSNFPVPVGASVQLVLSTTGMADLSVSGTVVWASPAAPFRVGVAFAEQHAGATSRWFDDLVSTGAGRCLERYVRGIPADAVLLLGPPPRFCPDFTPDEAAILVAVGSGLRAGDLRDRFQRTWSQSRHALFSLITRRLLTTSPAEAVPVARWQAFGDYLAALDAEWRRRADPPAPPQVRGRPADAQALYDAALALIASGQLSPAIGLLREGLARAPGDPEISATLLRAAVGETGTSAPRGR
ncbi:MAG TPA: PilZ domain-containing protein [Anaeromyxobacter sp.]